MANTDRFTYTLVESIIDLLDIPLSYYKQANDRYQSLGDWMHREQSTIKDLSPDVYPQGSFRYGTVIRPLLANDEYDLDLVCAVDLSKSKVSQHQVKELLGHEVKGYASANNLQKLPLEKKRCWRLDYQDKVSFHVDILPAVPQDSGDIELLIERQKVNPILAGLSVGITDTEHPTYERVNPDWLSSNPRGFGRWFENIARPAARGRLRSLVYASTEDVPPYEWKTPLQRSIQILKRHRDVMFKDDKKLAPISMIITTLAARSYQGETDVYKALVNILDQMLSFVKPSWPKVENPVNPAEDFADAWQTKPELETNFRAWHAQAKRDVADLCNHSIRDAEQLVTNSMNLTLTANQKTTLSSTVVSATPKVISESEPTRIQGAPKPWMEEL